ncbi:hypothetical protein GCM10027570_13480 [Streptomonospora sediminis]
MLAVAVPTMPIRESMNSGVAPSTSEPAISAAPATARPCRGGLTCTRASASAVVGGRGGDRCRGGEGCQPHGGGQQEDRGQRGQRGEADRELLGDDAEPGEQVVQAHGQQVPARDPQRQGGGRGGQVGCGDQAADPARGGAHDPQQRQVPALRGNGDRDGAGDREPDDDQHRPAERAGDRQQRGVAGGCGRHLGVAAGVTGAHHGAGVALGHFGADRVGEFGRRRAARGTQADQVDAGFLSADRARLEVGCGGVAEEDPGAGARHHGGQVVLAGAPRGGDAQFVADLGVGGARRFGVQGDLGGPLRRRARHVAAEPGGGRPAAARGAGVRAGGGAVAGGHGGGEPDVADCRAGAGQPAQLADEPAGQLRPLGQGGIDVLALVQGLRCRNDHFGSRHALGGQVRAQPGFGEHPAGGDEGGAARDGQRDGDEPAEALARQLQRERQGRAAGSRRTSGRGRAGAVLGVRTRLGGCGRGHRVSSLRVRRAARRGRRAGAPAVRRRSARRP